MKNKLFWAIAIAAMTVMSINANAATKQRKIRINDFPTIGEQHTLVVLVEFADVKFSTIDNAYDYYNRLLNEPGFTHENGANGSAYDFYQLSSNGLFKPRFDVVGPVTISKEATYYGQDQGQEIDVNMGEFLVEACQQADDLVDFTQYDTNNDGIVDNIYFFYAGYGEADSHHANVIWPQAGTLTEWGKELTLDGMKIVSYACSHEVSYQSGGIYPTGIGTFVHEFGHVLGLADHYDTSYQSGAQHPGQWDTMASGAYNDNQHHPPLFSAFERAELGWLTYTEIEPTPQNLSAEILAEKNKAFRITVPNTNGQEYFVLENRQRTNEFEMTLPGTGLLVWHIDMDEDVWKENIVNCDGNHQYLDIVEADKLANSYTFAGDPFPGQNKVTTFDFKAWNGAVLFSFIDVTEKPTTVDFTIAPSYFTLDTPQPEATEIKGRSFVLNVPEVELAKKYILTIKKQLTDGSNTIVDKYNKKEYKTIDHVRIDELEENSKYEVSVVAQSGKKESQTATIMVETTDYDFTENKPIVTSVYDITTNSFAAQWQTIDETQFYDLTLTQNTTISTENETFEFTGDNLDLPEGWTTNSKIYNTTLYGNKQPSLQLSSNDDYLELTATNGWLKEIEFYYRSQSRNNKLIIETINNGSWQAIETIETKTTGETVNIGLDCQRVRIRLQRTSGIVVIDDIEYTYETLQPDETTTFNAQTDGNTDSYQFDNLEPNTIYRLYVTAIADDKESMPSDIVYVKTLSDNTSIGNENINSATIEAIYDAQGRKLPTLNGGVNIVRMSNGEVKKIIRKR